MLMLWHKWRVGLTLACLASWTMLLAIRLDFICWTDVTKMIRTIHQGVTTSPNVKNSSLNTASAVLPQG
eukprot:1157653-Pelagomonas_calceolata.AAC.17